MIDTDKYEGHTEAWKVKYDAQHRYVLMQRELSEVDAKLIADAPLLLEEVKRLREELRLTKEWLDQLYDEELVSAFRYHVYGDEEE